QAKLLRDGHDAVGDRVVRARKVPLAPIDSHDPAVGLVHAAEDTDQRGFAGAVLADDGVDFAEPDVEVDAVERERGAESFADAFDAGGRMGHRVSAERTPPASYRPRTCRVR